MDFIIFTIFSALLALNILPAAVVSKVSAGNAGMSANHLAPAKAIVFPYRPNTVPLFDGALISAKEAIVMDEATGRILFQKNAYAPRPVASVTKLMTAFLWFQLDGDLGEQVEIKTEDYRDGSIPYFIAGDIVTAKDLLYAGLVGSSNSAMAALARSTGLTQGEFARKMTEKAKEMGMKDSFFAEPTGLDSRNVSTASDLFILARSAFGISEIAVATQKASYAFTPINGSAPRTIKSTDLLLQSFNNGDYKIIGAKTGYIEESDYNFVLKVHNKEKNKNLIIVILGSSEAGSRFEESRQLAEWAYNSYIWEL